MDTLLFSAACLATIISGIELTRTSIRHHDRHVPKSLSELAAAEERLLSWFRRTLFVCASLFAVTVYGFIVPRLPHGVPVIITWTIIYVGIMLSALLPARGKTFKFHAFAAQIFGTGMLALVYIFWRSLDGRYAVTELIIAILMSGLAIMTYADKARFIVYELAFIYLNHISIVIAAVALR